MGSQYSPFQALGICGPSLHVSPPASTAARNVCSFTMACFDDHGSAARVGRRCCFELGLKRPAFDPELVLDSSAGCAWVRVLGGRLYWKQYSLARPPISPSRGRYFRAGALT